MAKILELHLLMNQVVLHRFILSDQATCIGRHIDNDISIDEVAISSFHARIYRQVEAGKRVVYFEDLGSTNGSFINGIRAKKQKLKHNDHIQLANKEFRFFDPLMQNREDVQTQRYTQINELKFDPQRLNKEFQLSTREVEVLKLQIQGMSRKAIARSLDLSFHTVNDHVKSIYRKLRVTSVTAAVNKLMASL